MKKKKQLHEGFSLVEFIVILTLFAIMASVVTFDFQNFRQNIERSNLATDIALAYRQMQVYGISSSNRVIGGEDFDEASDTVQGLVNENLIQDTSSYGVELDLDDQSFVLFQEVGGNPLAYDEGTDVVIDILYISTNNGILRACVTEDSVQPSVTLDGSCSFEISSMGQTIDSGAITTMFKRPFPDATFYSPSFPAEFEPQIIVLVIGPEQLEATELRYVYLDAVGLVQNIMTPLEE